MLAKVPETDGADCRLTPAALAGHVRITFVSETIIVRLGGATLTDSNERLKTVPLAEHPPFAVVPYKVLFNNIKLPHGLAPSLFT